MQRGRFDSLDALRGLAILGMAWASMLPDTLPPWMYHAQEPPPDHIFNDRIFGLTWVDLVFPFFLFSMGVAIPLALSRRLASADGLKGRIFAVLGLVGRGLLLGLFALYGEHMRPGEWSSNPDANTYWITIVGFALLLLMFVRWRPPVPVWLGRVLTCLGWIAATALIATHAYPDGNRGFQNSRVDIILMVLANVAVTGGLIWMATRCRPWWRFGIMAAIALVFLTWTVPGSLGQAIWNFTPMQFFDWRHWPYGRFVPIFYHFEYQKYLLIVLPGTLCGDMAIRALEGPAASTEAGDAAEDSNPSERRNTDGAKPLSAVRGVGDPDLSGEPGVRDPGVDVKSPLSGGLTWSGWRLAAIFLLGIGASVLACWGMSERYVEGTSLALGAIGALLLAVTWRPSSAIERFVSWLCRFGFGTIVLGCLAEPIGGGIRKDEPTLSYFILTAGLAIWMLAALAVLFDVAKKGRWLRILPMTGMNPILAYVTITNLISAVDGLTGYTAWVGGTPLGANMWAVAFVGGGVETLVVALVASTFTWRRVFLRA